jgi:hypothetical protein
LLQRNGVASAFGVDLDHGAQDSAHGDLRTLEKREQRFDVRGVEYANTHGR